MPPEGKMVAFANDAGDMFIARIDHTLAKGAQLLGEDASGNPIALENP
jgi:hypothetical protein